jgi:hypothetical protein
MLIYILGIHAMCGMCGAESGFDDPCKIEALMQDELHSQNELT